ncbi:MAG: PAS domain S-box protein, partial [Thiohalorhabdaceae bacterium]
MLLYNTAFQEQRRLLLNSVRSHGSLIQSVARFDVQHSPDYPAPFPGITAGGHAATLDQIREAFAHASGPSSAGELVLGARRNGALSILLHQRPHQPMHPQPLKPSLIDKGWAEPMQRALNGDTGTMVGKDYKGRTVLAAYRPLPETGWGLVAKRQLAAIRAPYVRAGLIAGALGLAFVGIGGGLFHAATSPILRRLARSESRWERLFMGAGEGIATTDLQGRIQMANPRARHLFGLSRDTPVVGRP